MKTALALLSLFCTAMLQAQFQPCVDSARITPMFQCNDPTYNPVCGCNNITYRNSCVAYNMHGVNTFRSGVCSGIDLDFYPNPVSYGSQLHVNISYPEFVNGNADLKIVDVYGKVWDHKIYNNFNRLTLQLDISTLTTGVYLLVLQASNGTSVVRRLCKY